MAEDRDQTLMVMAMQMAIYIDEKSPKDVGQLLLKPDKVRVRLLELYQACYEDLEKLHPKSKPRAGVL